jgi:Ca-activated chloride channel family protein
MRGRLFIIVLALAAVAIAYVASGGGGSEDKETSDSAARSPAAANAMRISLAYSPEKEEMLAPLIKRFNDERHLSGGRPVLVDAKVRNSGDVEAEMARGREGPVMWSPSSSFWGRLLNYDADRRLVADDNPSIVRTPVVIAMWKRLADAYGYPERELGYRQLDDLATRGWAAVGKPQFGAFKYVHTNPDFSTSGLSAVSASYYAAVGKREGLTPEDVARARPRVRRLERSIVHYGPNTLFISEEMRRHGLGYASAVAMEETTLIEFNQNAGNGETLVAVYPSEGTFVSDNPLIALHGDWVSPAERKAAAVFAAYLRDAVTPEVAGEYGFRPSDPDATPAGLVTEANGVDPDEPEHVLTVPEPRVLARIKQAWHADRKPANVMLVFDTSASMSDERKLDLAKRGLLGFYRAAGPQDRMGLTKFSSEIRELVPIGAMKENRAKLISATRALLPEEDTRVRDATLEGVRAVEDRLDPDAINAVVVLTDGQDTASDHSGPDVIKELERQGQKESGQVRVFTIAYGSEPNDTELAKYAEASGGESYKGGTGDIASVYQQISSFF